MGWFTSCRSALVPIASDLLRMANFYCVAYLRTAILSNQSAHNILRGYLRDYRTRPRESCIRCSRCVFGISRCHSGNSGVPGHVSRVPGHFSGPKLKLKQIFLLPRFSDKRVGGWVLNLIGIYPISVARWVMDGLPN